MSARCLAALGVVAALAGRPAAQPTDGPAAVFAAGMAAYQAGDYAAAAAAFEEAFRKDPLADTAFTLANAHRNQYFVDRDVVRLHRALGLYRHYLAEAPAGRRAAHARLHLASIEAILASLPDPAPPATAAPPPTQLLVTAEVPGAIASIDGDTAQHVPRLAEVAPGAHVVRIIAPGHEPVAIDALAVAERLVLVPARLPPRLARLVVQAPGARVEIDGVAAVSGAARLPPGDHVVVVTARGHRTATRSVSIEAGVDQTIEVALAPTGQRRAARWTLVGATALAGGAAVAGLVALDAQADATIPAGAPPAALDAYLAARERRNTWRAIGVGLGIGAVAAGVTGAALWWLDEPVSATPPIVTPVVGPESIGAAVTGRF